jgi:hypothetical protein
MTVALAALAVLVPASVTLVGYWIKQQSERRLALRHDQDNYQSRIDLALRATDLFGSSGDVPANSAKSAAGLLALAHLDFVDLALALLVDLWSPPSVGVSTETAIQVINAALKTGSPDVQLLAAQLLMQHANILDITNPLHWPSSVDGKWVAGLPYVVKLLIIDALVRMAMASSLTESALRELAIRLYGACTADSDQQWKGFIGTLMRAIIPALQSLNYQDFSGSAGHDFLTLQDMERVAEKARRNEDGFFDRIAEDRGQRLAEWSARSTT